ncbi:hypothetical protein NP493_3180g00001 [Ridgeia piscesae]|uniref:SWIM-type domain-containing protein n=1 Tax=Ridgeia piscesae TaxID=27915 RepID=A0AAD9J8U0_RIDPI|nr:hypothetical protein NP493_3180g00001 [Ridgeia piscesae]
MLRVLRGERAHTTIIHQSSKSTVIAKATTEDRRFEGFLTSHAYGHVLAEIAKRDTVLFPRETAAPAPSTEGPVTVTDDSCTCAFPCTFRLPCRHILAHREMSCKSSFDADLADKRWTASYSMSSVAPAESLQPSQKPSPRLQPSQKPSPCLQPSQKPSHKYTVTTLILRMTLFKQRLISSPKYPTSTFVTS